MREELALLVAIVVLGLGSVVYVENHISTSHYEVAAETALRDFARPLPVAMRYSPDYHDPHNRGAVFERHFRELTATQGHVALSFATGEVLNATEIKGSVLELLRIWDVLLDRYNIPYWLDGGTLLGSWREGKFIEWDNDGDVSLTHAGYCALVDVLRDSEAESPSDIWGHEKDAVIVVRADHPTDSFHTDWLPIVLVNTTNGIYVDVMRFYDSTNDTLLCKWPYDCPLCEDEGYRVKSSVVFPLEKCKLDMLELSCPRETERYLSGWYLSLAVPWSHDSNYTTAFSSYYGITNWTIPDSYGVVPSSWYTVY